MAKFQIPVIEHTGNDVDFLANILSEMEKYDCKPRESDLSKIKPSLTSENGISYKTSNGGHRSYWIDLDDKTGNKICHFMKSGRPETLHYVMFGGIASDAEIEHIRQLNKEEERINQEKREIIRKDFASWKYIKSSKYTESKYIDVPENTLKDVPLGYKLIPNSYIHDKCCCYGIYNSDKELIDVQFIADTERNEEGKIKKAYIHGIKMYDISYPVIGTGIPGFIAEGLATACTIWMSTGRACVIAGCTGNFHKAYKQYNNCIVIPDIDLPSEQNPKGAGIDAVTRNNLPYKRLPITEQMQCSGITDANDMYCDFLKHGEGKTEALQHLKKIIDELPVLQEKQEETPVKTEESNTGKEEDFLVFEGHDDMLAQQTEKRTWLWRNWIITGRNITIVYGASNSGKTHFCVGLAVSIACGIPFLGLPTVPEGCDVLYITAESKDSVVDRYVANYKGRDIDQDVLRKHWHFLSKQFFLSNEVTKLERSLDHANIHPVLIIFDTFTRFIEGNENEVNDINKLYNSATELGEYFNCQTLFVHHTGKSTEQQHSSRGSSAIKANADLEIEIEKDEEGHLIVNHAKPKINEKQPSITARYNSQMIDRLNEDGSNMFCVWLSSDETPEPVNQYINKTLLHIEIVKFLKYLISDKRYNGKYEPQFEKKEVAFTDVQLHEWFDEEYKNLKDTNDKQFKNKKFNFLNYDVSSGTGKGSIVEGFKTGIISQPKKTDYYTGKNKKRVMGWKAIIKDTVCIQEVLEWWTFQKEHPETEPEEQQTLTMTEDDNTGKEIIDKPKEPEKKSRSKKSKK